MSPRDAGPGEGCAETRERLDDYAAGALDATERARLEAHLATCEACRGEAEAWAALLADARSLPRAIAPPRDLWAGIDARIGGAVKPDRDRSGALRGGGSRAGLPRWALAAAALALVVVTAALSSLLTRRWDEALALKTRRGGAIDVARPDAMHPPDEARYLAASRELLAGLERQELAPETMTIVRRNLAVIDAAIAELHEALEKDPGNGELTRMLLATYQQKIDLLEQAARAGEG